MDNVTTGKNHAYCSKECYDVEYHGDNSTVVVAVKSAIDGVSSRLFTFNGLNPSQSRPSFKTFLHSLDRQAPVCRRVEDGQ